MSVLRAKIPTRSSLTGTSGQAWRKPEPAIASPTLAPCGNSSSRRNTRSGAAQTTLTRMVARSGMGAVGFSHEIVHHAVGEFLEAHAQRQPGQRIADLEIQRQADLAAFIAERREHPFPAQGPERAFHESHADAVGALELVAGDEVLGEARETQVQSR